MDEQDINTSCIYNITSRFLCTVGLIGHQQLNVATVTTSFRCLIEGISCVNVMLVNNIVPFASIATTSTDITLVVTKDYKHALELLKYNNTDTIRLMQSNILVVHTLGMMCTLSSRTRSIMTYFNSTKNHTTDRRLVINKCNDAKTVYEMMPYLGDYSRYICSHKGTIDDTTCIMKIVGTGNKSKSVYYHRIAEPLETLGVDYIFSIFRISRQLYINPKELVYVFVSESAISVLSLSQ